MDIYPYIYVQKRGHHYKRRCIGGRQVGEVEARKAKTE